MAGGWTEIHLPTRKGRTCPVLKRGALCRCAQAMRTVEKNGLQATAKKVGLDLYSLPFTDARKARTEWLAQQPGHPPQSKVSIVGTSVSRCLQRSTVFGLTCAAPFAKSLAASMAFQWVDNAGSFCRFASALAS